jgi:hypothetical protein
MNPSVIRALLAALLTFSLLVAAPGCGNDASTRNDNGDGGHGTAVISWTPPTQRIDGSHLDDLAGYRLYYGRTLSSLDRMIDIANAGQTSQFTNGLAAGTWYFAVTAYTREGLESPRSLLAKKTIH